MEVKIMKLRRNWNWQSTVAIPWQKTHMQNPTDKNSQFRQKARILLFQFFKIITISFKYNKNKYKLLFVWLHNPNDLHDWEWKAAVHRIVCESRLLFAGEGAGLTATNSDATARRWQLALNLTCPNFHFQQCYQLLFRNWPWGKYTFLPL